MSLVAQTLDEIEDRVARRQAERFLARHVKRFSPGVAIGTLRDANQWNIQDTEPSQCLACCAKLTLATIYEDEVGPGLLGILVVGC